MFTKPLSYIITKTNLLEAYEKINKNSSGLDGVNFVEFEKDRDENIAQIVSRVQEGIYSPEPIKKIAIDKPNSSEQRPIGLSTIKDKLVQRVLYENLNPYYDKQLSNASYAYRPDKSTLKAINRTTGYLNEMDSFLEQKNISFVRYADDFALFFQGKNEAYKTLKALKKFLTTLHLKLGEEKTAIVHISDGFTFLGVEFRGKNKEVQEERLQNSLAKLQRISQNRSGFKKFVDEVNFYLQGIKNYYLKILTKNSQQYLALQNALSEALAHKVFLSKKSKNITTKKEFIILLEQVKLHILFDASIVKHEIKHIVALGYEQYLADKSYKDTSSKIAKKKNKYARKFANDSTLHVATPGLTLGISKNKFTLKKYGKVQNSFPMNKITRIVFEGKGFSLSTNVIKKCADNAITIDFINRDATSYAALITYKSSMTQIVSQQAKMINTPLQLALAKAFIRGKAKNQLNYIKYLHKYHKNMQKNIQSIEKSIVNMKTASSVNEVMGYEGSISATYWDALKLVLEIPFSKRITFGAKDIVNSSLNYAYAFLYGKVQHSLVHAGLSLNISFLHSLDEKKPTLTYDMIEEFRTFIVDRTIISMLNKDEPIRLGNDGLLTQASRQLIAKNIKEKLGSYTMWKKESIKCENIIQKQCFLLAKVVKGEVKTYKAFIGKY